MFWTRLFDFIGMFCIGIFALMGIGFFVWALLTKKDRYDYTIERNARALTGGLFLLLAYGVIYSLSFL